MKTGTRFREPVRVEMHFNGGFTRVVLERTIGGGMANGGVYWDIQTDRIPLPLRAIGSRFLLITRSVRPEPHDSPDSIRAALGDLAIEELSDST